MPPRDRRFETERGARSLRRFRHGLPVMGQHRLVRGHDVLARDQRRFDGGLGRAVLAAHRFDHQIDVVPAGEGDRVVLPRETGQIDPAILAARAGRDGGDGDRAPAACSQKIGVAVEDLHHAAAHRAETGYADAKGLGHGGLLTV